MDGTVVTPVDHHLTFRTDSRVPRLGMMLVGWGGNNGTTVTAGILANKLGLSWSTKEGLMTSNYYGSVTQASTMKLGNDASGNSVHIPFKNILPMVSPNDIVVGGWDISSTSIADAMRRAKVLDYDLQTVSILSCSLLIDIICLADAIEILILSYHMSDHIHTYPYSLFCVIATIPSPKGLATIAEYLHSQLYCS